MSRFPNLTTTVDQAKQYLAVRGPEEAIALAGGALQETSLAFRDAALSTLALVCARLGVPPTQVDTQDGNVHTLVLVAGDTEVGKLTLTLPGGEASCLNKEQFRFALALEIDGALAARYLCTNPDHHDKDEEPVVELAELPEELKL